MSGVVVLGSGGHAAVSIDVLQSAGFEVVGCLGVQSDRRPLPVPMLGGDDELDGLIERGVAEKGFVAIGDNAVRRRVTARLVDRGVELVSAVSPSAAVSTHATVRRGALVMPGAVVNAYAVIGEGAIVNTGASVDHDCTIGPFAHIGPGCHLAGTVEVGSGTFLGVGCHVIPGIRIGAWVQVGAGAAVVDDLPDGVTAWGVPARVMRTGP